MAATVEHLTPVAEGVLTALAAYRFLTVEQMLALRIARDKGHLHKILAGFLSVTRRNGKQERKPKEIGELDFGALPGKGRLARIYYLTKRGAELLELARPELIPVPFPVRVTKFNNDYFHRIRTVDFHIALATWAAEHGYEVKGFCRYFDYSPASSQHRPHPKTTIHMAGGNIIPDALFTLLDERDPSIERLCAFEMANGRDTGRVLRQMAAYAEAIDSGRLNEALNYEYGVRVLFVFEHQRHLELVQERGAQIGLLGELDELFFLKTYSELRADDLIDHWRRIADPVARDALFTRPQ